VRTRGRDRFGRPHRTGHPLEVTGADLALQLVELLGLLKVGVAGHRQLKLLERVQEFRGADVHVL
jgi:hypothetical protein